MATRRRTSGRTTVLPGIGEPPEGVPEELRSYLRRLQENVEVWRGERGDSLDQVITRRDLLTSGIGVMASNGAITVNPDPGGGAGGGGTLPPGGVPPTPTGLFAAAAKQNVLLSWGASSFPYLAYTEIWRSTTNDLGTATRVGTTRAFVYADPIGESQQTLYYWIRFVSESGNIGAFNDLSGTAVTTGQYTTADIAAGTITADSGILAALAVVEANIADLAVTDAKIGQFIKSVNYLAGVMGWIINKNGYAEFQNILARGDIEATSIKANVANIIDTINLRGNAVTIPVISRSPTLRVIPGAWTDVISITIDSVGQPDLVTFSCMLRLEVADTLNSPASAQAQVRVIKDGNTVTPFFENKNDDFGSGGGGTMAFTIALGDTPGLGLHTYVLQFRRTGGASENQVRVSDVTAMILEAKR